jgi:ParB family chromosome partitioning protein
MNVIGKHRALGRGLGALIPPAQAGGGDGATTHVPQAAIRPNPLQPRQHFAEEDLDALAESIRSKGILQPLLVRPVAGGFELIAGERRLRAAQRLGMEQVPVTVRAASDSEMLEMALIENLQRQDLNPLEEARAYRRLAEEFHLTQDEIAARVGKDRSTVANTLRLLQLPDEIQTAIERGLLSAGHARALAGPGAETAKILLAQEVISRRLTVRQTEKLAKEQGRTDAEHGAVEQRLMESLGTRVHVTTRRNGSGKIEIEFYTLEELNGLIGRLTAVQAAVSF